jgi:error-prone DNA polymerase
VEDIVREANNRGILCQGRGSAANSAVCYCLGITAVNPDKFDLLFERFLSPGRTEPPDIDVDFEHERREEMMQYIFNKYGRNRAAIVSTVTQVRQKTAIQDVGRIMGLSVDTRKRLSSAVWNFSDEWFDDVRLKEQGLNPDDPFLQQVLALAYQYLGFPRQLGQHTGGFIITQGDLSDLCPTFNATMPGRTCIEWNKDDIDALGFLKIDVLALGMLTCIRKAFDAAKKYYGINLSLADIPLDDPRVYEMISQADTVGLFQIESRAQRAMLPKLQPREFYDLVIQVAIVRPGPIVGQMVHPYLRRRRGEDPIFFPTQEVEGILSRTLGVPLFQEQVMELAMKTAGFTPADADRLRRSMATFKVQGIVSQFKKKLICGMMDNGFTEEYAERIFQCIEGFGSYGFPESHAASFALIVIVSAWLKCYYPDLFFMSILNSMPMGFYHEAQLLIDARKRGIVVRPVDINHSDEDNILEETCGTHRALRLGLRNIIGLRKADMGRLVSKRANQRCRRYESIVDLRYAGLPESALELLSNADAFNSIGLDRRQALWELSARDTLTGLFKGQTSKEAEGEQIALPFMSEAEHVIEDHAAMAFSLRAHFVSFIRPALEKLTILPMAALPACQPGQVVRIGGTPTVRQMPGTAKGVMFMTVEDETGEANIIIYPQLVQKFRQVILQAQLIIIEGQVQRDGDVINVITKACYDFSDLLDGLDAYSTNKPSFVKGAIDKGPGSKAPPTAASTQESRRVVFSKPRNFK